MEKFGVKWYWLQIVVLLVLTSCGSRQQKVITVDPGFGKYISGYTSGMVHNRQEIRIDFAEEIQNYENLSDAELNSYFSIQPATKGEVKRISSRKIAFYPAQPFQPDQFYTVSFELDKLFTVNRDFKLFQFQFATLPLSISYGDGGLYSYHTYELDYQRFEASIYLTDYVSKEDFQKTISLQWKDSEKQIPFKVERQSETVFSIVADSILRQNEAKIISLKWDGEPIQSLSKGKHEFDVAAKGDFYVLDVKVYQDDQHYLKVFFSEPINKTQQLKGLIELEGMKDLTFKVKRNVVTAYLPSEIIGNRSLNIHTGIKNSAGHKLKNSLETSVFFDEPSPKLKLIGKGSILPDSKGLSFPFKAKSLKSVDVRVIKIHEKSVHHFLQVNQLDGNDELTRFGKVIYEGKIKLNSDTTKNLKQWNTHVIDLEKLIKSEQGAIYQVAIKFSKEDATCTCDEEEDDTRNRSFTDYSAWTERYWHRYGFDGYSTWSYYDEYTDPCSDEYYYGKAVRRNILASNLGIIFKLDEDKTGHIIVSDMTTTLPVAGAQLTFFDYSKGEIAKTTTDAQGMAKVQLKEKPFLLVARQGTQRGYLKLTDGSVNSLSKFDVSGQLVNEGVKGFLYAERGVWRPGDSIYLQFMLQDERLTLPKNHPVYLELFDPNGALVTSFSSTKNVNNVYDLRTATKSSAATGNYRAVVKVGNTSFSKNLKVETVKPNRLKIELRDDLSSNPDSMQLAVAWLHGGIASNLKASLKVKLSPMKTQFKGFHNFLFDSPIRNGHSNERTLFENKLNEDGNAMISKKFAQSIQQAPGKLQANYTIKATEKSGEFSIVNKFSTISPYDTYVGLSLPLADKFTGTWQTGQSHRFEVVNVNANGQEAPFSKFSVRVYKVNWNWWYDGEDDLASFISRSSAIPFFDTIISAKSGKSHFNLAIADEEYGKYVITVTDEKGGHQTGAVMHFDWSYWHKGNESNNEHAAMLRFATDKKTYTKGENIFVSFPSPEKGRALVSIESTDKVLKKYWIETKKGETTASFLATKEMAPNCYVHVTLLQPHAATTNDLPIRMYGVLPIKVEDPATHLHPIITMKDEWRPNQEATIKIKEENGRKMTYTIAIVDEGLLSLTNFKTPQPHAHFYAKEALGVKTWDMYDDVIGAFGGKLDYLLSIGGDGEYNSNGARKANRFEPMVRFLGPFELPAGRTKEHLVSIPNYIGSVKVMVVARQAAAYGQTEKTARVNQPVMVISAAPRVLSPNEEFDLPVTVFAMDKSVNAASVKLSTNENLEVIGAKEKLVEFSKPGEQLITFKVKVKEVMGIAAFEAHVQSGNEKALHAVEIAIEPPNPKVVQAKTFTINAGDVLKETLSLDGIKGSNSAVIEFSTIPTIHLEKRMSYLLNYPHGCIEQTTSAVFPQLFLHHVVSLSEQETKKISHHISSAIRRLLRFQTMRGGFSYWPGESTPNEWGTNYAGHFMLEAEKAGYLVPKGLKDRWLNYQKERANQWSNVVSNNRNHQQSDQLTQAYRLYLLALAEQPELGAMNRLRELPRLSNVAAWRLASAYAIIGQPELAKELYNAVDKKITNYRELSDSYGSSFRDLAVLCEVQLILGDVKNAQRSVEQLAKVLSSDKWLSTQETGYSLMAIANYCVKNGATKSRKISYTIDGINQELTISKAVEKIHINESASEQLRKLKFENTESSSLFVTITTSKIPTTETAEKHFSNLGLSLAYFDWEGNPIDPKKIQQGQEFKAEITLHNPTKNVWYQEMALHQFFPSGWEIHNDRLFSSSTQNAARYQDIRDDRVYSYFDLKAGETKKITVQLTATYCGKFYHPSVFAEAMYDNKINGLIPGFWVEVVQ